tara:strand:+ start:9156 stop:10187 length:1032 start_codon:yes stop_codon:yes gene_type:complete
MPYYPKKKILFIHIPKTGGTSLEDYFRSKSKQTLYCYGANNKILPERNVSLQHQFYSTLEKHSNKVKINFKDPALRIYTIVRDPYNRLISDLFHFKLIKHDTTPEQVHRLLVKTYLNSKRFDNHNVPQYKFICNEDGDLMNPKIVIFRTESLAQDLEKHGFKRFKVKTMVGKSKRKSYDSYFNKDSIELINNFYRKDFEIFGYSMKNPLDYDIPVKKYTPPQIPNSNSLNSNSLNSIKPKQEPTQEPILAPILAPTQEQKLAQKQDTTEEPIQKPIVSPVSVNNEDKAEFLVHQSQVKDTISSSASIPTISSTLLSRRNVPRRIGRNMPQGKIRIRRIQTMKK